jgi:hypothetical protein
VLDEFNSLGTLQPCHIFELARKLHAAVTKQLPHSSSCFINVTSVLADCGLLVCVCRSTLVRYFTRCTAPESSTECPGNPRWISAKATAGTPDLPEDATTTVVNGTSTLKFDVTTGCSCSNVYYGIVNFGDYRNLPTDTCTA